MPGLQNLSLGATEPSVYTLPRPLPGSTGPLRPRVWEAWKSLERGMLTCWDKIENRVLVGRPSAAFAGEGQGGCKIISLECKGTVGRASPEWRSPGHPWPAGVSPPSLLSPAALARQTLEGTYPPPPQEKGWVQMTPTLRTCEPATTPWPPPEPLIPGPAAPAASCLPTLFVRPQGQS